MADSERRIDRRTLLQGAAGASLGWSFKPLFGGYKMSAFLTDDALTKVAQPKLKESMTLAGKNLLAILNPEDRYLPYWEATVRKNQPAALKRWWPAHNIGRWWDAMLRLESTIGFEIPDSIERAMVENTHRFFDNPDHICLNPDPHPFHLATKDEGLIWDLHSLREGMLALHDLAKWRNDDWAVQTGRKMIRSVDEKLLDDGNWDLEKFDACQKRGKAVIHNHSPSDTHGRLIEALVWFYDATGESEALALADRLANWHFENTTLPDGGINPLGRVDHTHSYFGTLRGLLLFGRLTHQKRFAERVEKCYAANVPRIVKPSGYTSHNLVVESFGETTSPGDAAQLALWLYQEGYPSHLDDIERIVRARILPSQILQAPEIVPEANDGRDPHREIGKRIIGAFGGCTSHPHGGKLAVTDVTSADVHTLCDIYANVAPQEGSTLAVMFHLDYEDDRVRIESRRAESAHLRIDCRKVGNVAVRIPQWAPSDSLKYRVAGRSFRPVLIEGMAHFGRIPKGGVVEVEYALPERWTRETDLGVEYELKWRGDDVLGIRPNADFLPFYPDVAAE
jgi:hypothetical protein